MAQIKKHAVTAISSEGFLLAAVMVLAAVLSFLYLGNKSFWMDEGFSATIARMNWPDFRHNVFTYEFNQILYYFLLRFWIYLGQSEFILRSLSVIFALGAVGMVYIFGKRLFGSRTGLIAAFLITINAYFIAYAQEARAYMLVVLLATLSSYFFVKSVEKPRWKTWSLYVLFSALGVYAHIYMVFMPAAHIVSMFFMPRKEIPWKYLVVSAAAVVVFSAPMIIFALTRDIGQINWVSTPGLRELSWVFSQLSGRGGPALTAVYFILGAVSLVFAAKAYLKDKSSVQRWRYGFLLTWLFLPIFLAFVFSFIKPIFVMRYLIICLPPLVILVADGLYRLKFTWLKVAALLVLAALSAIAFQNWYSGDVRKDYNRKDDFRGLTTYIVTGAQAGDAVVFFHPMLRLPYDYYHDRLQAPDNLPTPVHYLNVPEDNLNLYYLPEDSSSNWILPAPDKDITERLSGNPRVWLVLGYDLGPEKKEQSRMIKSFIEGQYNLIAEKSYFDNIRVYLYTLKGS